MMQLKHETKYYETGFFKWRQRVGFGISDFACNLAYLLTNTYLLFYYTNCAKLDAGQVGFMFIITKFIDAITDYLVGTWVDRTDTKMGRYRPWMLFGAPVLAIGMVLLFSIPVAWPAASKLVWAYVTYVIFSFGYTLVNIPMAPMVSSLSDQPVERTNIMTTKQILASCGSLVSSIFVIPLVQFFAGGSNAVGSELATGYRMTNVILGVVVIVLMVICVFNVEEINPPTISKVKSNIFVDMKGIFKNKYYIMILLYVFFNFLGYLAMMAAIQYYFTYIIGNTAAMTLAMSIITLLPIPVMVFAAYLNAHGLGKAKLLIIGGIISLIALSGLFFSTSVVFTMGCICAFGIGNGMRTGIMFAALPDIYDYTEYQTGKALGGTQTAVVGFGSKLASAMASATVSALLVWGAYDAGTLDAILSAGGTVADIATAYPTTVMAIKLAFAGFSIFTTLMTVIVMLPYDLDKKYPEISKELERRKVERAVTN